MSKNNTNLTYIFKINSSRLRKSKWNLKLTLSEAKKNEELIALADSQTLRFIRQIANIDHQAVKRKYKSVRGKINRLKKLPSNKENGEKKSELYNELFTTLSLSNYIVSIVMDELPNFDKLNKEKCFCINGIKFKRLLATPGGGKNSTVFYVAESIYEELTVKLDNGRNKEVEYVPEKFEAYKALSCSQSRPVPVPDTVGVLVVKDCKVNIEENVYYIDDSDETKEPDIEHKKHKMENNNSDGYGLISPTLAKEWADHLGLDYTPAAFIVRNAFCKGTLMVFDFHDFALNVVKSDEVVDVWTKPQSISKCSIVLTESMLKLWAAYGGIKDYLDKCKDNGFTFSVTKETPKQLENERELNYQFIQSLDLSEVDIDALIKPTVDEIKDVLGGDWRKSLLFLKGVHLNDQSYEKGEYDFSKALMIDKELINDPFVRQHIYKMIHKRIKGAKMGELRVRGNFSIISGCPYSLCQSMFNEEVTGLLKEGEFYSNYWNELGVDKVAGFRAPMSCHNNIRILRLKNTEKMRHWYKHMNTVTIFNTFDTTAAALNGADMDGDSLLTTDCATIQKGIQELDAIICNQRLAKKKIITEELLIQANKNSFGDKIGAITNRITSMFDVKANFEPDSEEYKKLEYRIMCGQNYQQNAIDKTKGIESNDMPKYWYDYHANKILDTDSEEDKQIKMFNQTLMADKKPYFFIYRYPELRRKYNTYIKKTNNNCLNRFGCTVKELIAKADKSEDEQTFLMYYNKKMPVSMGNSVMNKLCWKAEEAFERIKEVYPKGYDYTRLTSDTGYNTVRYKEVSAIYEEHKNDVRYYMTLMATGHKLDDEEYEIVDGRTFLQDANKICNNAEELCNIVVELCYKTNNSKQFAWDIAGETIIENLLKANDYTVSYPTPDPDGDIEFKGERFSMHTVKVKESEDMNELSN